MNFSVQLYGLRDMVKDRAEFPALFPKLKELGFDGVELWGVPEDPAALRRALDGAGLAATGAHFGLDDLRPERLPQTIAVCKTLGMPMMGIGGADHGTPERLEESCAVLKVAYDAAKADGITVYYHNHESEFEPYPDGTLAIDRFMAACALQLDSYWSFAAGIDNFAFLLEHKERICAVHIKDGVGEKTKALGEGDCDLASVVRAAKAIGLDWLVLENDDPAPDGLSDAARSMVWLRANV